MAFTFGLGMLLIFPWRFGGAAVTIEQPGPKPLLEAVAKFGVTHLATAPAAYKAMLGCVAGYAISSLTACVSAGEHLPAATWQASHEPTGLKIVGGIGATKMMHIFISASDDDIRPGATGKAVPGYQACVLDEAGTPLPHGTGRAGGEGADGVPLPARSAAAGLCGGRTERHGRHLPVRRGVFLVRDAVGRHHISSGYNIAAPEVENACTATPP